MTEHQRIQKIIAGRSGISRRQAEKLIEEGKVSVNGETATLGQKATPEDKILVNGKILKSKKHIYIALNKPEGYLSTTHDPHGGETILDLLPKDLQNLKPAGRLDKDSEGLIILSTDGDFIQKLTHPKHTHEKEYLVRVKGKPTAQTLEKLTSGKLKLDGYTLNPMPYKELPSGSYILTLSEGRKRQIREVFKLLGHHVLYLRRLRVGPIGLDSLEKGEYRHLTQKEIRETLNN